MLSLDSCMVVDMPIFWTAKVGQFKVISAVGCWAAFVLKMIQKQPVQYTDHVCSYCMSCEQTR